MPKSGKVTALYRASLPLLFPPTAPLTLLYFPQISLPSVFVCSLVYGLSPHPILKYKLQGSRDCSVD